MTKPLWSEQLWCHLKSQSCTALHPAQTGGWKGNKLGCWRMFPEKGRAETETEVRGIKSAFLAQTHSETQLQHPAHWHLLGALQLYVTKTAYTFSHDLKKKSKEQMWSGWKKKAGAVSTGMLWVWFSALQLCARDNWAWWRSDDAYRRELGGLSLHVLEQGTPDERLVGSGSVLFIGHCY